MHCRLCSYQSDQRLMLNVFEQESAYAEKIENYLGLKVSCPSSTEILRKSIFVDVQNL